MMIDTLFFDLSGVLYTGSDTVPGAVDAVERGQANSLALRFVTNTSRRTRVDVMEDLASRGFMIEPQQIFTAPAATKNWLKVRALRPYCLVHRDIQSEFSDLEQQQPNAVVIGDAAEGFCYDSLNRAFQLCQQGAPLIGIGYNRYFKLNSELLLDAGPFIKAIEFAASVEAVIIGKPSQAFFQQVLDSCTADPQSVMMIGDDVFGDIEGALKAGLQACLVKTGKYQQGDEQLITGDFHCVDSVVEAVDLALADRIP